MILGRSWATHLRKNAYFVNIMNLFPKKSGVKQKISILFKKPPPSQLILRSFISRLEVGWSAFRCARNSLLACSPRNLLYYTPEVSFLRWFLFNDMLIFAGVRRSLGPSVRHAALAHWMLRSDGGCWIIMIVTTCSRTVSNPRTWKMNINRNKANNNNYN